MYFTSGSDRAFEQLMQTRPGADHFDNGEAGAPEDCGTCRFYRPHWKYQFCVYEECPYQPGKLTALDGAVKFQVKGVDDEMAVFRVEKNRGYTVMSNHHLRNKDLSLKAKGLGLWFQTLVVGLTMNILSICIFLVTYGRMIEIYAVTALGPIPLATLGNAEWRGMGQNYLKSLLALGFQAFLIMVVVGIYAVLIQQIGTADDISGAIWGCMGYTVLLCFCLFKTGSISKAVFTAH